MVKAYGCSFCGKEILFRGPSHIYAHAKAECHQKGEERVDVFHCNMCDFSSHNTTVLEATMHFALGCWLQVLVQVIADYLDLDVFDEAVQDFAYNPHLFPGMSEEMFTAAKAFRFFLLDGTSERNHENHFLSSKRRRYAVHPSTNGLSFIMVA